MSRCPAYSAVYMRQVQMQTPKESFVYKAVPTNALFGPGSVEQLSHTLASLNGKRALYITSEGNLRRHKQVSEHGSQYIAAVFSDIAPHCPEATISHVIETYRAYRADTVICLGGGSTLGLGKVLSAEFGAKFIAIPTTYSGSEMTPIYGRKRAGQKATRIDHAAIPDAVIYDPALTLSLPARETASTGMNSLAHAIEGLYPAAPNPIAPIIASQAISYHARALPVCTQRPDDLNARAEALYAGFLGGLLVSMVGVALHHAIGHIIGGLFDVDHGDYNSALLPHITAFNAPAVPVLASTVCSAFAADNPGTALSNFSGAIGAPCSLREIGVPQSGLNDIVQAIMSKSPRNPRPYSRDQITTLIQHAFEGRKAHTDLYPI